MLIASDEMRARMRVRRERDESKIASVTDGAAGGSWYRGRSGGSGEAAAERSGNEREGKEESTEGTSSQVLELERPWSSVFDGGVVVVAGVCCEVIVQLGVTQNNGEKKVGNRVCSVFVQEFLTSIGSARSARGISLVIGFLASTGRVV